MIYMKKDTSEITVQFLGAAGTVTGSKYLIQAFGKKILVDCGLFQGLKKLRLLNWAKFPVDPATIDLVLLTHGHLDHVGYLPRLIKSGYQNPVWSSLPTSRIAKIILKDSARIQEEEAERANLLKYSKHNPAIPLYTLDDVEETCKYFVSHPIDTWIPVSENMEARFRYNGHIIGSTFIELKIGSKLFVFSGDIGKEHDEILMPPHKPEAADVLFIESTYGDRLHPADSKKRLSEVIMEVYRKHGTLIIPSFAVERTQALMFMIWQMKKNNIIPEIPVFMDSPMGKSVLDIFSQFTEWHTLSTADSSGMCKDIRIIHTSEETEKVIANNSAKIIISGSGMASGGRVLRYFQKFIGDKNATILFVGYQAEGTRGRQLLSGVQEIKMFGEYFPVKAEIKNIEGLSAHADQLELINWMQKLKNQPEKIFIVHGEPAASDAFRVKVKSVYGWNCILPELNQLFTIPC